MLSPVELRTKQPITVEIDVPRKGPVRVEATVWNVRAVKSGRAHKKTWSIGMMVTEASDGFQALLPRGDSQDGDDAADQSNAQALLSEVDLASVELSSEWEESAAEWDQLFAEAEELLEASEESASQGGELQMFRVRVKALKGPRTRMLTLSASSESEAEEMAHADLGEDAWRVLEISPA